MAKDGKQRARGAADRPVVGIPRAMLYYRYRVLWESFFLELGIKTVRSPKTNLPIMEKGSSYAGDEMCLSAKIYMGHVAALIGKCDYILVPRISNFGRKRNMCTRFEAMHDICRNVFRDTGQRFIAYNVDVEAGLDEERAFIQMAVEIGCTAVEGRKAFKTARKMEEADWKSRVKEEEQLWKKPGLKVLLGAHSYVIEDPYVGRPVIDFLENMGVTVIRSDITDRDAALKKAEKFSPTMKWEVSREIAGGLAAHAGDADGIILVSVFPCGPDAMVNEMIMRRKGGIPVLNLVLDSQTGTAGLETRLESFVDILARKGRARG